MKVKYDKFHKDDQPLFDISVRLNEFGISVRKSQYDQIICFSSIAENYAQLQINLYINKKQIHRKLQTHETKRKD